MRKNDDKDKPIEVSGQYPARFSNSKFGFWYTYIIETLINLLSSGPADYTLTERELNHKETPRDILNKIICAVAALIILYFVIKYKQ